MKRDQDTLKIEINMDLATRDAFKSMKNLKCLHITINYQPAQEK